MQKIRVGETKHVCTVHTRVTQCEGKKERNKKTSNKKNIDMTQNVTDLNNF